MCSHDDIQQELMRLGAKLDMMTAQVESRFALADARYEQNARRIHDLEGRPVLTTEEFDRLMRGYVRVAGRRFGAGLAGAMLLFTVLDRIAPLALAALEQIGR